ncbi:hypothetical protein GCM10023403_54420 [Pseudonocardia benzenivorans]
MTPNAEGAGARHSADPSDPTNSVLTNDDRDDVTAGRRHSSRAHRRRQRQFAAAFSRYQPNRAPQPVPLLPDHVLDAWLAAYAQTRSWWAIPRDIRPQVRRYAERLRGDS